MAHEPWPAPTTPSRPALPRVEDLPIAEHGYERDSVERAFDAFYRHLAQVDATLRVLEAVDAFNRSATELRTDLRTLRAAGWVPGSLHTYSPRVGRTERPALPDAFPRVALEAAFIIIVAVTLGIARWNTATILLVMGLAWAIVCLIEWVASRERAAVAPAARTTTVGEEIDDVEEVAEPEPEAVGWAALEGAGGDASDEMTMMGAESRAAVAEAEEPAVEPVVAEPEPEPTPAAAVEPEPLPAAPGPEVAPAPAAEVVLPEPDLPEPDLEAAEEPDAPRRRWFRRRRDADADGAAVLDEAPAAFDDEPDVEDVPQLVDDERVAAQPEELPLDVLREHRGVPYAEPRERRRLLRRGRR